MTKQIIILCYLAMINILGWNIFYIVWIYMEIYSLDYYADVRHTIIIGIVIKCMH